MFAKYAFLRKKTSIGRKKCVFRKRHRCFRSSCVSRFRSSRRRSKLSAASPIRFLRVRRVTTSKFRLKRCAYMVRCTIIRLVHTRVFTGLHRCHSHRSRSGLLPSDSHLHISEPAVLSARAASLKNVSAIVFVRRATRILFRLKDA